MPSLSAQDRVSLCQFTFADGRRCRTPRTGKNPHFCFDHAQKEARANAVESLSKDLAYFFSGDYLSACDLSTALGRLIPAVIRGDVKPRNARTVAYMAQTLLQSIHLAEHEYTNTFGSDGWRKSIRHSVNANYNHRFPRASQRSDGLQAGPQTEHPHESQPQPHPVLAPPPIPPQPACPEQGRRAQAPAGCHSEPAARQEESAFSSSRASSPHTPLPPTGAEFAQQLLAGSELVPAETQPRDGAAQAPQPAPASPGPRPQPAETPVNCHSACPDPVGEPAARRAEPAFSSSPAPSSPPSQPAPFMSRALPPHVRRHFHRTDDDYLL